MTDPSQDDLIPVSSDEPLSRFAFSDSDFQRTQRRAKYNLFFRADGAGVSVIRIAEMTAEQIWTFGDTYVARGRGKPILGRVDFPGACAEGSGLQAQPTKFPPRHADLVGWPEDKERRRNIAQRFADDLYKAGCRMEFVPPVPEQKA